MLVVTCSNCGSKRNIETLEALAGARFCDICGKPIGRVEANIPDLLPSIQPKRANIPTEAHGQRKELEKQNQQTLIEEESVRQRELEATLTELRHRERETRQRISDVEKKLKSEEDNLQQLNKQTFALHKEKELLENERRQINSNIEEKIGRIQELEERIRFITKRETEITQKTKIQETKLKSTESDLEQSNKRIRELNQETQLIERSNHELSKVVEEKTNRLLGLEASIQLLQQRIQELNNRGDRETALIAERETKLKSVEHHIRQINDQMRELENTAASLSKGNRGLEETHFSLKNQNQELDNLLQDKQKQLLQPEIRSNQTTDEEQMSDFDGTPSVVAKREAQSFEWLGIVAKYRKDYDLSEMRFRKALQIRERLGDELDVAFTLSLLSGLAK